MVTLIWLFTYAMLIATLSTKQLNIANIRVLAVQFDYVAWLNLGNMLVYLCPLNRAKNSDQN